MKLDDGTPVSKQVEKIACRVVCSLCDESPCVGRENCPEIKEWIKEKLEEIAE